ALSQLGRKEVDVGPIDNFVQLLPKNVAESLVGKRENTLAVLAQDVLRQAFDKRVVKRLGVAQRLLEAFSFNELADLAADGGKHLHQIVVRLADRTTEELADAQHLGPQKYRESKGAVQPFLDRAIAAREIRVLSDIDN